MTCDSLIQDHLELFLELSSDLLLIDNHALLKVEHILRHLHQVLADLSLSVLLLFLVLPIHSALLLTYLTRKVLF